MRALLLITAFFVAIPLASGTLQPRSEAQYWANTNLDGAFLRGFISNLKCMSSPTYYRACVAAIQTGRAFLDEIGTKSEMDFEASIRYLEETPVRDQAPREMIFGKMFNAFLHEFDAHARLLPTELSQLSHLGSSDSYYGMGMRSVVTGAGVLIHEVYPQTPAERAGFSVGDRLLSVDGVNMGEGPAAAERLQQIGGALGTVHLVELERAGIAFKVPIEIGVIDLPKLESRTLNLRGARFGYVRVGRFVNGTCEALKARVSKMRNQIHGLVLDLRDNPGGLINEAVCTVQLFAGAMKAVGQKLVPVQIPVDVNIHTVTGQEPMDWVYASGAAEFKSMPLVVLVDQGSASAAELVAAALQDARRAWLLGERTFGKGTMQNSEPLLSNPALTIVYTFAIFYRSRGTTNQLVGVNPDFEVPFQQNANSREREFLREKELFPNSLTPREGENSSVEGSRTEEVRPLEACLAHRSDPEAPEDFQLARALELLRCILR